MLGAPSGRTSRPRAPSRAGSSRRSTTNDEDLRRATNTPPPPYDPRSSNLKQLQNVFGESEQRPVTLLGSSVLATAQMLGYELPEKISEVPDDQALQQKSREELFELLRNAETLIRTHETGELDPVPMSCMLSVGVRAVVQNSIWRHSRVKRSLERTTIFAPGTTYWQTLSNPPLTP